MKKILALAAGFVLPGLMLAAVHAGPNDGAGPQPTEGLRSVQSGTSVPPAPKKGALSRHNKAVMEQKEAAKMRRARIQSGGTGTTPGRGLSRRNKAVQEQRELSRKRRAEMQSGSSPTMPK